MLERTLADLDLLEVRDLRDDILRRIEAPARPGGSFRPGPRPRRLATIGVALVISVAAAALVWRAFHPTDAHRVPAVSPTSTVQTWSGIGDGWTGLDPPPEILESSVQVWTGRELILWGGNEGDGQNHSNTGYAFDSGTLTWRTIAPSPLGTRSFSAAVWTGREVLIWGGSSGPFQGSGGLGDGAAYDPSSDTWRPIAQAPIGPNAPILVAWTGREMVLWGIYRLNGAGTGAAYDPSTDSWRTIPDPPVELNDLHAVWTGDEVIAFGANLDNSNRADTEVAIGAAYDPVSDAWRTIAPSELSPQWSQVVWDGVRMIAVDANLAAASYDPSVDEWTAMPSLPAADCEGGVASLVRLRDVVMATGCGQLVELVSGSERWHVVTADPNAPFHRYGFSADLIGAGEVLLAIRSYPPDAGPGLFAYRPPVGGIEGAAAASDLVAAFAGLRNGYPYEGEADVSADTLREMSKLLSPEGAAAWDAGGRGLRGLWEYYTGFEILEVSAAGEGRFRALLEFSTYSGPATYRETLTLAPGEGLDGELHDLVVVDATGDA
jgi:hypothetical protein